MKAGASVARVCVARVVSVHGAALAHEACKGGWHTRWLVVTLTLSEETSESSQRERTIRGTSIQRGKCGAIYYMSVVGMSVICDEREANTTGISMYIVALQCTSTMYK